MSGQRHHVILCPTSVVSVMCCYIKAVSYVLGQCVCVRDLLCHPLCHRVMLEGDRVTNTLHGICDI